jgi:hypothetical protein
MKFLPSDVSSLRCQNILFVWRFQVPSWLQNKNRDSSDSQSRWPFGIPSLPTEVVKRTGDGGVLCEVSASHK